MAIVNIQTTLTGAPSVISSLRTIQTHITGIGTASSLTTTRMQVLSQKLIGLSAIVGLGAGSFGAIGLARSFLQAGSQAENLRVRMLTLLGAADKAKQATQVITDYAARVAFTFEEVERGTAVLLAVERDVNKLGQMLEITGDIATGFGLSFDLTAIQLQRAFSAGIRSSEIFRERAVAQMLGFQQGVTYSAEETKKRILEIWEKGLNPVVGKAKEMANTWTGITSMMEDMWVQFQRAVMNAGLLDYIKGIGLTLLDMFQGASASIDTKVIAQKVEEFIGIFLRGMARLADALSPALSLIFTFIGAAFEGYMALPEVIREWGLILAIILGKKGLVVLAILSALTDTTIDFNKVLEDTARKGKLFEGVFDFDTQKILRDLETTIGGAFETVGNKAADAARKVDDFFKSAHGGQPFALGGIGTPGQYMRDLAAQNMPNFGRPQQLFEIPKVDNSFASLIDRALAKFDENRKIMEKWAAGGGTGGTGGGSGGEGGGGGGGAADKIREMAKSLTEALDPLAKYNAELAELEQMKPFLTQEIYNKQLQILTTEYNKARVAAKGVAGSVGALTENMQKQADAIREEVMTPFEKYSKELATVNMLFKAGAIDIDVYNAKLKLLKEELDKASESTKALTAEQQIWINIAQDAFGRFKESLIDIGSTGEFTFGGIKDVIRSLIKDVMDLIIQLGVINPLMNSLFKGVQGYQNQPTLLGVLGSVLPSLFGSMVGGGLNASGVNVGGTGFAPFARGGTRTFTRPSLISVAEMGPERVTVGPMGAHSSGGGGGGPMIYIDASGSNGDASIEAAIDRALRRVFPNIVTEAVEATRATFARDNRFMRRAR